MNWILGGPMTTIVAILVVAAVIVGVGLIRKGLKQARGQRSVLKCPNCLQKNLPQARFCAHCGQRLK
ncbi:MAG: hypothetical protein JSV78_06720 [Phycisphaerales bacterium]|nr:MAG: hypothetical protein JSV78_06720 [Phycisphaerales bacterium]